MVPLASRKKFLGKKNRRFTLPGNPGAGAIKRGRRRRRAQTAVGERKGEEREGGREEDAAVEEVQEGEAQVQGPPLQQAQGRQDPDRAAAAPAGAPRPRHRVVVHLPPQARRVRYTCAARFSPSPVPYRRRFREFSSMVAAFPQICAGGRSARALRLPPRPPAHPGMPLSPMAGCGSNRFRAIRLGAS